MEFMKITDRSIKISLEAKEAMEYKICEGVSYDEGEIRSAFSKLLDMAKKELGMKLPKGQLLCEVFSSRDGGYEIFVSYLNGELEEAGYEARAAKELSAPSKKKNPKGTQRTKDTSESQSQEASQSTEKPRSTSVGGFVFEDYDALIYLTSLLKQNGKNPYEIYFSNKSKKYYLIINCFKKGDMYFSPFYELALPVKQGEIRYIESYCEKITP